MSGSGIIFQSSAKKPSEYSDKVKATVSPFESSLFPDWDRTRRRDPIRDFDIFDKVQTAPKTIPVLVPPNTPAHYTSVSPDCDLPSTCITPGSSDSEEEVDRETDVARRLDFLTKLSKPSTFSGWEYENG